VALVVFVDLVRVAAFETRELRDRARPFSATSGAPTVVEKNAGTAADNEVAAVRPAPATAEAAVAT
jgi:hypothetical protein